MKEGRLEYLDHVVSDEEKQDIYRENMDGSWCVVVDTKTGIAYSGVWGLMFHDVEMYLGVEKG